MMRKHVTLGLALLCACSAVVGLDLAELGKLEQNLHEAVNQVMEERELDDHEDVRQMQPEVNHVQSSAETMRAFKTPSKSTRQLIEKEERATQRLESIVHALSGNSHGLLRGLNDIHISRRALEDPLCTLSVNCSAMGNESVREYRTANGTCNNLVNETTWTWGSAGVQHLRWLDNAYENGIWAPRANSITGTKRNPVPLSEPRNISNQVHAHSGSTPVNTDGITNMLFQWGQFLDHDIIRTPDGKVPSDYDCCTATGNLRAFCRPMKIAAGDPAFPNGICMDARRSMTVLQCGATGGFQNQYNEITAYIDASNVYGSSNSTEDEEMNRLRSKVGGRMKTSTERFPPESATPDNLPCEETSPGFCFDLGDIRGNVLPGLTSFHSIFVREHNRIATYLADAHLDDAEWTDEKIFQETRNIVAAMMQRITYNEFLPLVLSATSMTDYGVSTPYSYNSSLDASITQAFSIAFRFGHSLIPATVDFAHQPSATVVDRTSVNTEDAYKHPSLLLHPNYRGIDQIGLGLALHKCPKADRYMEDAARNKLFEDSAGNSFDLASLNIMRGREWGTPPYCKYYEYCGFGSISTWDIITSTHTNTSVVDNLKISYVDPCDIDLWTGIVTETPLDNSMLGKVGSCIVGKMFGALKHGDRFNYETPIEAWGFNSTQRAELNKITLARVLCDNLSITMMRPLAMKSTSDWVNCTSSSIPTWDLSAWGL